LESKKDKIDNFYDNELEPPGAATLPVRAIIPRILSGSLGGYPGDLGGYVAPFLPL
jgi:hypothetical protein